MRHGDDATGLRSPDPFAAGAGYRYTVNNATNVATVYSLGENGVDDGVGAEEYLVNVDAASPGWRGPVLDGD